MPRPIRVVQLREGERGELQRLVRSRTSEQRVIERARIVLASADGHKNKAICAALGVSHFTVRRWLDRYDAEGLAGLLRDRPRSGRPKEITVERIAEVVRLTQQGPPPGQGTHWSLRTLAPVVGLSRDSVRRIWKDHGLQPHRVRTFKLSRDPRFVEKDSSTGGSLAMR